MATTPIDLSAGFVPKQQPAAAPPIDISAGLIPKAPATAAPQEGFWHSLGAQFGMTPEAAEALHQHIIAHPVEAGLEAIGGPAVQTAEGAIGGAKRIAGEIGQAYQAAKQGNAAEAAVHAITALPFVGPALNKGADQYNAGDTAGEVGTALGSAITTAPMALAAVDEVAPGRATIPNPPVAPMVRRLVAGDVNAPIAGTDLTPAQRYASMKAMGVQPNAAEATNSTPLNLVEKVNQNSLTAAPTYARVRAANMAALNRYADRVLNNMSPSSPEEGGAAVQQGLLQAHADLKAAATEGYKDLDSQVGNQPVPGSAALQTQAQSILDENAEYYKQHPELEPTKAMAIVRDLANAKAPARPGPKVTPGFGPEPAAPEPAAPRVLTYSELHRLRSDLLDFNNTNPDLVKNQANGWIAQLAGAVDRAITTGEGALTPPQLDTFRNANSAWKYMKDTYDNPSHPFYQAVRNPSPSTLVNGVAGISRTPETVKALQAALPPEAMGDVQRGVAQNLLGTTKEGTYNFRNFQGKWNKLPQGLRDALFTPEQQRQLEDIGNAGTVMHEDANPSGTAKLGQGQVEMEEGAGAIGAAVVGHPAALAGTAAYHALQYGAGRVMNYPGFVDWLMRDQGLPAAHGWTAGSAPAAALPTSDLYQRSKAAFEAARAPAAALPTSDLYQLSKAAFEAARARNQ